MEKKRLNRVLRIKNIRYVILFFAAIFILTFVIIQGLIIRHAGKAPKDKADVIIILGARLYGRIPSPSLQFRLDRGYEYLLEHPETMAVVSGGMGRGEEITEAEAMKDYLITKGIAGERIFSEDASYNTVENIRNSISIIEMKMPEASISDLKFGIVSNDYHIFRGTLIAEDNGLEAFGIPAKTPPSFKVKGYLREYLSVLKYLLIDRIRT